MDMGGGLNKIDVVSQRVLNWLRQAKPGQRLLPERQLAAELGVSRDTVRRAVDRFVERGLLQRVHGSGVYARLEPDSHELQIWFAYRLNPQPDLHNDYFFNVLKLEFELYASANRINLVSFPVYSADTSLPDEASAADGIIVPSIMNRKQLPTGVPLVVMNFDYYLPDASYLLIDNFRGGADAARYLISLGHEHIGFVGDTDNHEWAAERLRGVREAAAVAGFPQPVAVETRFDRPINGSHVEAIRASGVTGLVVANDYIAMSLISTMHRYGIRVPEDVSVISFDDAPNSGCFQPPLTTMKLPVADMVETAFNLIRQARSTGGETAYRKVIMAPRLVVRESCRRLVNRGDTVVGSRGGAAIEEYSDS